MSRIFSSLAVVSAILLIITIAFGLRVGSYNEQYAQLLSLQQQMQDARLEGDRSAWTELEQKTDQTYHELSAPRRRAQQHMLVGIFAGLVAVLVNSISVTYFIGTSRWCKEVVDTYELDGELSQRSARFKRRSFTWSLAGILTVLTIVALGAASDPGTLRRTTMHWVVPHYLAALGGGAFIVLAFLMQAALIRRNSELVDQILRQVQTIRKARGLDT